MRSSILTIALSAYHGPPPSTAQQGALAPAQDALLKQRCLEDGHLKLEATSHPALFASSELLTLPALSKILWFFDQSGDSSEECLNTVIW
ncbi:hypothetical protein SETIT_1G309000v2 [Setaria italica]|uniref:Uncharacterized protein n=2 Tax=Setaria TaxID=4554 RepID=A0A368PRF6_SETIT|nr:hypothetical protein SETIT_1G309000v2 [Setaria italica]TKW41430.1 hypothetical protein SEVIR_1G315100v2 [Setaria viridis]